MAEDQAQSEKPKRDYGKLGLILFLVFDILGLGIGVFMVYSGTVGYEPPSKLEEDMAKDIKKFEESLRQDPIVYSMEPFTTNLSGVPKRLVRIEVNLEMLDEEGFEEVFLLGAGAKDSIVRILNAKNFDDLDSVQGKLKLKNEIITEINSYLEKGVVKNIYFSDFVVQ